MITTGYPYVEGRNTEIVDVENSDFTCTKVSPFPVNNSGAIGGLIDGKTIFICGGTNGSVSRDCYSLNETGLWAKDPRAILNTPRYNAAYGSVVMNGNQLVLSGGHGSDRLKTIEVVSPNVRAKLLSVKLPVGIYDSCIVPWDNDTFFLVGGDSDNSGDNQRAQTYFINIKTNQRKNGPSLNYARYNHACEELNVLGKSYVVVTSGVTADDSKTNSTEILDKNNIGQGWIMGKRWI